MPTLYDEAMDIIKDMTRENPFVEGGYYGFTGKVCKFCGARQGETNDGPIAETHDKTCLYRRAIHCIRQKEKHHAD